MELWLLLAYVRLVSWVGRCGFRGGGGASRELLYSSAGVGSWHVLGGLAYRQGRCSMIWSEKAGCLLRWRSFLGGASGLACGPWRGQLALISCCFEVFPLISFASSSISSWPSRVTLCFLSSKGPFAAGHGLSAPRWMPQMSSLLMRVSPDELMI
jgi:hypothetical protein